MRFMEWTMMNANIQESLCWWRLDGWTSGAIDNISNKRAFHFGQYLARVEVEFLADCIKLLESDRFCPLKNLEYSPFREAEKISHRIERYSSFYSLLREPPGYG